MNTSNRTRTKGRSLNFRKIVLLASAGLFALSAPASAKVKPCNAPGSAQAVKVNLGPDLVAKFPCLPKVLDNLLRTFESPDLWGKVWNEGVPKTGIRANYKLSEMAGDFKRYLTDGKLRFNLKIGKSDKPAGEAIDRNTIFLHQSAGLWMPSRTYSDYGLAVTVAHELVRVWQFDYQWFPTLYPTKNDAPYYIAENNLPKALFNDKRVPDPGGTTPAPCLPDAALPTKVTLTAQIDGVGSGSSTFALPKAGATTTAADYTQEGLINGRFDKTNIKQFSPAARAAVQYNNDKLQPVPVKLTMKIDNPLPRAWLAEVIEGITPADDIPTLCAIKPGETSCEVQTMARYNSRFSASVCYDGPFAWRGTQIGFGD